MNIKMCDLLGQYKNIEKEVNDSILDVINSTSFINGNAVSKFSSNLASYLNVSNVIPCGNGTDALQIAFMALGLKRGDEVILPVHTYVATAEVIALLGLEPVFVDVDKNLFTIDVSQIQKVITSKTKAIVPVHLYGQCANMEEIMDIAKKNKLFVIEDAAQSLGAEYTFLDGSVKKSGTIGDIGCTSFFPSKNLGCFGDGGALFVNNDKLAKKVKMIANHGQSEKYHHDIVGCNSRLDTIQAAILKCKLPHLDTYSKNRNFVADYYDLALKGNEKITIPKRSKSSTHVFHQYTILIHNERDKIKSELAEIGIPSMVYYPIPLHFQKAYRDLASSKNSFPISEKLSQTVLSLPIHTEMTIEKLSFIVDGVLKVLA